MTKTILLAGAAMFIAAAPAYAQEVDSEITFENNIAVSSESESTFVSDFEITGDIEVTGLIDVDSAAIAMSDSKQIITDNEVRYSEATNDEDDDGDTLDDAEIVNTAAAGDVDVDGNAGVNVAAGHYNVQSNIGTIAVASGGDGDDAEGDEDSGGWAKANTTTMQSVTDTYVGPDDDSGDDNDTMVETNDASTGAIGGAGNVGVNVAAGAFNAQQNIMTLAVATDSALADASAAVIQNSSDNESIVMNTVNTATTGAITGAGNVGVNVAAGVGNLQHNSLTVAASGAFGGGAGTGGTGAGGTGGTGGF